MALRSHSDYWEKIVIVLGSLVGIGSFLFNTFASPWSAQADIIPIWLFVGSYTLLIIYRLTAEHAGKTIMAAVIATILMLTLRALTPDANGIDVNPSPLILNGSLQYLPVLFALIAFSLLAHCTGHAMRNHLLAATILFFTALVFRTIDIAVCDSSLGISTHFMWHILNGLVVWTSLQALVLKLPPLER